MHAVDIYLLSWDCFWILILSIHCRRHYCRSSIILLKHYTVIRHKKKDVHINSVTVSSIVIPIAKNTTNISQIYHKSTTKCGIEPQKCDIVTQNRVFYYKM